MKLLLMDGPQQAKNMHKIFVIEIQMSGTHCFLSMLDNITLLLMLL